MEVLVRSDDRNADHDLLEEAAVGVEDDAVDARLERRRRELGDAAVLVGLLLGDQLLVPVEADREARSGPSLPRVEDVSRDHELNFSAWRRCSCAISSSEARTSSPSRTISSPPTSSRSTRCGAEKTSPATGSPAPPSSSMSVRQTARSAQRPGSIAPRSWRPRTAALPRVASLSASRAVS